MHNMMKGGGGRKIPAAKLLSERKDRDDQDLVLFRDLHRREKDRMATSLLQPVSDEFEPNPGNYALDRMASGRKGPGYEFFAENDKNDYDWLKTPPATPLFPSLEMEANAPKLLLQRDIPILQPLSRFRDDPVSTKGANNIGRPKSPKPKPKVPLRSAAPSQAQRPNISLIETKTNKPTTSLNHKTTTHLSNRKPNVIGFDNTEKTTTKLQKDTHIDFLTSNLTKNNNIVGINTKTKPRSRGVSPSTRSTIPLDIPGFSNEAPPNLLTDISRSTSATRGRPLASNSTVSKGAVPNIRTDNNRSTSVTRGRPAATANTTRLSSRQSRSPSVTRGRKVTESNKQDQLPDAQKGKSGIITRNHNNNTNNIGTQILGSRMVDRLMNARSSKSGNEETESTRPKSRGSVSQVTASATTKMTSRSSHMVTKQDRIGFHQLGTVPRKSSTRE